MSSESYYLPLCSKEQSGSNEPSAPRMDSEQAVSVEQFSSTDLTISVWSDTMQHGAPPSALLVRALEQCAHREDVRLTRVVVEILGPIPIADLEVRSWVQRPGRKVELVVAELWTIGDRSRAVARGTAWRMETVDTSTAVHVVEPPLEPPSAGRDGPFGGIWNAGYLNTLDLRWLAVPMRDSPGKLWAKPKPALVLGESMTPLERLFTVADLANGVGAKLDPTHWTYLNTDLTVHILRVPESQWVGICAETSIGPDGVGMCAGVLYDETGAVGRITQTLQVRART
ncbi:thioesterase family protein [Rhodococcus marinonascens]|uniref:thioesterase family protein n=1 Tax=Rhodococcus marinonascens TaxID=38311 RepID=UPI00093417C7|nr:thioesterase family protein [Rhodococcus marinonascens]